MTNKHNNNQIKFTHKNTFIKDIHINNQKNTQLGAEIHAHYDRISEKQVRHTQ